MKNSIFIFLISSFLFPAALFTSAETLVGELSGEFVVNNLGAASYTIPLNVSPGTAGLEPKLAVSYSSRGDNGLLGMGFSLSGLSTISRGGTSLDQDGFIDGVDFDENDRFLLDGQRLNLVSTNGAEYGQADTEYRTEIDSFSRVIAYGQAGTGPAWFKVWTKSGLIYEYGNTADSSFEPGSYSNVLRWAVNKISDTAGNYMTFTYQETPSGPQISRIDYTGNAGAALTPYNSVEYIYEERPDPALSFFKGARMEQTTRLAKIIMKHDGNYLHDYRFTYNLSEAGQSIVESFQQFFGEGSGADCLPQTRFEYDGYSSGTNLNFTSGTNFLASGIYFSTAYQRVLDVALTGDFNGDGFADIASMGDSSTHRWVGLSNGDGSFIYTSGTNFFPVGLGFSAGWYMDDHDLALTGDFNGDGLMDICGLGDTSYRRWVGLSNGDGTFTFTSGTNFLAFGLSFSTAYMADQDRALIADFNGDGLSDICGMGNSSTHRWIGLSNGAGTFSFTSGTNVLPIGLNFSTEYDGDQDQLLSGDFNGDGLSDICSLGGSSTHRWVGLSNGDGTFSFTSGTNFLAPGLLFSIDPDDQSRVLIDDFNGDGLSDICSMGGSSSYCWIGLSNGNGTFTFTSGVGLGFTTHMESNGGYQDQLFSGDFNGDGLIDICALGSSTRWLGVSKGDGTFEYTEGTNLLTTGISFSSHVYQAFDSDKALAGDFNGDGLTDVCALGSSTRWLGLSRGDGTFEYTEGTNFLKGFSFSTSKDPYGQTPDRARVADFSGDGITDICCLGSDNWIGITGNKATRAIQITQGYQSATNHGVVTEIAYRPITDTNVYVKGSGAEYPVRDIISPIHVVTELIKDNGQEGTYRTQYAYRSARYHVHGRGFLGFQQFISYDYETDLCYTETLAPDFPFTGRRLKTETFYIPDPDGDPEDPGYKQLIKQVDNTWLFDLVSGGTLFTYNPKSVETKWELGDTNTPVSVVTAYNWFDNQDVDSPCPEIQPTNLYAEINVGNLVKNVIDYGGGLKKTTFNTYDDWIDSTHWMLGRLDTSTVTHEAPGQSNVVRSSSFDYDAISGLLSQEVIEPGDPDFELITDYAYDGFGNITNKTITPAGFAPRAIVANTYDAKGRFVEESRNALGHPTTFVNDQALGKPLSSTDPNNLTTEWEYDQTGRLIYEERPDGTVTTNQYIWDFETTVTVPDVRGTQTVQRATYKTVTQTDGKPSITVWYDKQGRSIRSQTQSADGRTVIQDTGYNAIAQPVAVSEPYFSAGGSPLYTFTEYDGLGRPQYITAPDGTVTETVYDGLSLSVIKDSNHRTGGSGTPKHQITTSLKNAKGELLSVTDAMSNTVTYMHDAVGNLTQTIDPENNVIEMAYDIRGNKRWQSDPDMGVWNYTYNSLDQLVSQTDANGNVIEFTYDLLGRPETRTNRVMKATGLELESTAQWFYDGTSEGDKLGLLRLEEHRAANGDLINRKRYAYDQYSRPMLELMNYDEKWYYTGVRYDAFDRVEYVDRFWRPKGKEGIEYNLDPEWKRFTTRNIYNPYGAMLEVSDADNHTWWQCSASDYDEHGRLTGFEYGNGLTTTNTFNPFTGRIEGIGIADSSQLPVSSYQFGYDRIGNLTERSQSRPLMATLSEISSYDALNRLIRVDSSNSWVETSYDSLGNIRSRSDTGTYLYSGSRPHAVSSAGDCTYYYDPNGNVIRRDRNGSYDSTTIWNSFNKPVSIFAWDNGSEFEYDVGGKRTKQLIINGTNIVKKVYATPAYEMREVLSNPSETNRALWEWEMAFCRIYVDTPAGRIGIYQEQGSTNGVGLITRSYIHKDHLGSVIAVSDDSTNITFYSYDAWGNRRNADDWLPITNNQSPITNEATDRGFTGHEQLDHVGLVHMNGRIYDPVIGKMISPDPLIQAPENLQSFNRYSYVWNNPLTKTDPSGFAATETAQPGISGTYENYVEPVSPAVLAEQDSINSLSDEEDSDTDATYNEWEGEDGEMEFRVSATTTFGSSTSKEEVLTGTGVGSVNDAGQYGMDTGGGILGKIEDSAMGWKDGIMEGAVGLAKAIANPAETSKALINAATHPKETAKAVKQGVVDAYDTFKLGDHYETGRLVGKLTFDTELAIGAGAAGKAIKTKLLPSAEAPKMKTVLGNGADVAPFRGKQGYNVLDMDRTLPLDTRKAININWLDDAINRGDDIILKTDPIKWDGFMREIGKESFYNELELPHLMKRGVIDNVILDY